MGNPDLQPSRRLRFSNVPNTDLSTLGAAGASGVAASNGAAIGFSAHEVSVQLAFSTRFWAVAAFNAAWLGAEFAEISAISGFDKAGAAEASSARRNRDLFDGVNSMPSDGR